MTLLNFIQIIVSILLISAILLQSRGSGLGGAFGGQGKSYHSRRGLEKFLFKFTVGLAMLFVFFSVLNLA